VIWWWGGATVLACAVALLAGVAGHGMWAAVGSCVALGGVGILIVRLDAARVQLARSRHDTDAVVESLSGGLLSIDTQGTVKRCNPAAERILGLTRGDLRGRTLAEVFQPRAPLLYERLERSLREGTPIHRFELQIARPDAPPCPIGLSTSLMRGWRDEIIGLLATFQDLSEVRRMQERVRRADRLAAVGQLAASIAHEIRNPLAAIANSVDMLREELVVEGEQRRLMDLVVKESERLNRILDDFLEYASSRPLDAKVVPVRDSVEEVVTLLRNHPDVDAALHIELQPVSAVPFLACIDEELMKQVYVNLAVNAFEAMGHKGVLQIRIERTLDNGPDAAESPYVQLFFRDTGPGIEPGHEADIFEPFHTTKPQGTGLGLSIAAKIVESHGGRLEAVNHPAGGAEFVIELPEVTGAPAAERPRAVQAQPTAVPVSAPVS